MKVGDQKADIITLQASTKVNINGETDQVAFDKVAALWMDERQHDLLTSTGFLLKMKKCSALIIINRMNFLHNIFSISSALENVNLL